MLPLKKNGIGLTRLGTVRLPIRSVRAGAGSDAASESASQAMVEDAAEKIAVVEAPGITADSIPVAAPEVPKPAISEVTVPETLDMKDILPEVKGAEETVADKVESIFSKASNVFQKMQPETSTAVVSEPSKTSTEGFNLADTLQSIKEATSDKSNAPLADAAKPSVSSVTSAPPSPPAVDTVVSAVDSASVPAVDVPAIDLSVLPGPVEAASTPTQAVQDASQQAGPDVVTRALEYTDDVIDRAEGMVSNFIDNATGQATTAMQSVGEGVYNSMPKSLPPNLQTKADVIGNNIAAAKEIYDDAPGVYLLLAALAIGSSAYAYWKYEFGGYKGVYKSVDLLEALNREENVFVVDIRPEEDLKEMGVLDLKRGARGKATHLPLVDVPDAVKGDIDDSQKLQLKLNAALVTSLNEVNRFTKIVVMDRRGTSVKGLARAISELGYRGYMLRGGFNAWKAGGLATKFGSYAVTPADLLADKGEELSEAAEQTAEKLRQPRNAALALLTFAAVASAYLYPHETFRVVGVVGIELTILVKLLSYESPSAAVDDVNKGLNKGFQSFKESFSSAKAQAAEFAEVAQARSATNPQPTISQKPKETSQKSSAISEARESVAAEAVKEAQAALERMVAQSKEEKPPPVPAPQASAKSQQGKKKEDKPASATAEKATPSATEVKAQLDGKSAAAKVADKPSVKPASKELWPADEKKDDDTTPKPVVDSLPYFAPEDKSKPKKKKKSNAGNDGMKPAAKGD